MTSVVPLYPALGAPEGLAAFQKAGRTVSYALSPRANALVVYETQVSAYRCEWSLLLLIPTPLQKDLKAKIKRPGTVLYFAHWDNVRTEDVAVRCIHNLAVRRPPHADNLLAVHGRVYHV